MLLKQLQDKLKPEQFNTVLGDALSWAVINKHGSLACWILNYAFAQNKVPTLSITGMGNYITSLLRNQAHLPESERKVLTRTCQSLKTVAHLREAAGAQASKQGILSALATQITQLPPEMLVLILSFALHPSRPSK